MSGPDPSPEAIRNASIKAYHAWGEILLERFHGRQLPGPVPHPGEQVPLPETVKAQELKVKTPIKRLAIVGGGVAGLYTAMLLREHGHEFDIDIYEANDRIGGRLYTHHFNKKSVIGTPAPGGEFDYFVRCRSMRFPDIPIMAKTFELFKLLKVPRLDYNISDESNWLAYNGVRKTKAEIKRNPGIWAEDPFKVSKKNGGTVPDKWARQDPSALLHDALKDFIKEIVDNPKKGLQNIIDKYDHFSTRSYLASLRYPPAVINWIETMAYGTGWFDRGLIETILEQMAFMYNKDASTDLDWYCVRGGSEVPPLKMVEWLKEHSKSTHIHMRHRVTKVDYKNHELIVSGISHPLVTGDASFFKQTYSHVVFAIPPPCLRMINLDNCELDYAQRSAMRSLQLAPSSKIGMKFKTAWWQGANNNHIGGQSTTDRTARTIVYPSHGDGASTVLIVSNAWTQDSLALAAMMHGPGSAEEERLKQIMLEDLAYVHNIPLRKLADEFEYMFAFDWSSNPLSMGAFGLFGPSQFREFYRHVTRPAARGQIYFVGETFSTTHGWVAGALNSAERGVLQLLQHHRLATHNKGHEEDYIEKFLQKWKPDLEVTKEATFKQLITSLLLQHEEFD